MVAHTSRVARVLVPRESRNCRTPRHPFSICGGALMSALAHCGDINAHTRRTTQTHTILLQPCSVTYFSACTHKHTYFSAQRFIPFLGGRTGRTATKSDSLTRGSHARTRAPCFRSRCQKPFASRLLRPVPIQYPTRSHSTQKTTRPHARPS